MDTKYQNETFTVTKEIKKIDCTVDWYACTGSSPPRYGSKVEFLNCGEEAYGAIEQAIKQATASIDLAFWGFDYSTQLTAGGKTIWELLQDAADRGVKVHLLLNYVIALSGRKAWGEFFIPQTILDMKERWMDKIIIRHRHFTSIESAKMAYNLTKKGLDFGSLHHAGQTFIPSHHQKMVLIDCLAPKNAKAFVMGLNMAEKYRDSKDHYYGYNPDTPDKSWQDLAFQVEGPVIYDIYQHFLRAWERSARHQTIFGIGGITVPDGVLEQLEKTIKGTQAPQFCCTQSQEQEFSILESYQKALKLAHNYIYIENQYIRYVPFAEMIKEQASSLQESAREKGKKAEDLYLFMITTYSLEGAIVNGINTYRMLETLGQQQLMPRIQKSIDTMERLDKKIDDTLSDKDRERIRKIQDVKELTDPEKYDVTGEDDEKPKPFEFDEIPGLKVVTGVLYTDSTHVKAGGAINAMKPIDYRGIDVHSKLLLVDDIFASIGSANLHARGLIADSEANISIPDPDLAYKIRNELWSLHAGKSIDNGENNSSAITKCDAKKNYEYWEETMNENWKYKGKGLPLKSHLCRFWDDTTIYGWAGD